MSVDLPNTSYARDLFNLVQRSDVDQMSFAFQADDDCWDDEEGCDPEDRSRTIKVRTLRSVRLIDVACVVSPAYGSTSLSTVPSQPFDDGPRSLPQTCPLEMRSQILSARQFSSKAKQARQRLFSLILS
jgi:phage head maturation protease